MQQPRDCFGSLSLSLMPPRYRKNILDAQQPCFHLWFVDHFAEPTAWFEARTTFARYVTS